MSLKQFKQAKRRLIEGQYNIPTELYIPESITELEDIASLVIRTSALNQSRLAGFRSEYPNPQTSKYQWEKSISGISISKEGNYVTTIDDIGTLGQRKTMLKIKPGNLNGVVNRIPKILNAGKSYFGKTPDLFIITSDNDKNSAIARKLRIPNTHIILAPLNVAGAYSEAKLYQKMRC